MSRWTIIIFLNKWSSSQVPELWKWFSINDLRENWTKDSQTFLDDLPWSIDEHFWFWVHLIKELTWSLHFENNSEPRGPSRLVWHDEVMNAFDFWSSWKKVKLTETLVREMGAYMFYKHNKYFLFTIVYIVGSHIRSIYYAS